MRDLRAVKILSHKRNIQRYTGLLATDITELEREYLHKQIAKEQAELERWTMQSVPDPLEETSNGIAATDPQQTGQRSPRVDCLRVTLCAV